VPYVHALQQISRSFDDLVRAPEQRGRNFDAEDFRGDRIDDQVELGRLLDRDVGWLGSLENSVDSPKPSQK